MGSPVGLFEFLNHWWNAPVLVMLGLVAAFFVLQTLGLLGGAANHEVDGGVSPDTDADLDHDLDHDVDHDVDHDTDADVDGDADAGGLTAAWHEVLSFLGVGRVPFMVVWVVLFLFWGFGGLIGNRVALDHVERYPWWFFIVNLLVALFIGLVAVRLFSRLAARFVDVGGHGATVKHELVGKAGVVASSQVDARFGEIRVKDARGGEQLIHGRTRGDDAPLKHGARVVIVDWDDKAELFWVAAFPDGDVGDDSASRPTPA
jgi:Inner membrane protein YqiJ, N-terminal